MINQVRPTEDIGPQGGLSVLADVQAHEFLFLAHPQWDNHVGDLVEHPGADERVRRDDYQGQKMVKERFRLTLKGSSISGA